MDKLPVETVVAILMYLPTRDRLSVSCVCRRLRSIVGTAPVNRCISFKDTWDIPSTALTGHITKHCNTVYHLDLRNCYWLKASELCKPLLKLTKLKSLDIRGCLLGVDHLISVLQNNENLETLGWSVDKKTMTLFSDPVRNVQKIMELHRNITAAFAILWSLKLSFFMGKPSCFEDFQSLSRILSVFLHGVELNHVDLTWPDCTKDIGTLYEANAIVIQALNGKKTALFSFARHEMTDVESYLLLQHFFVWKLFVPMPSSEMSIWIFPIYKSYLVLISSGNHSSKCIFEHNSQRSIQQPVQCIDMSGSDQYKQGAGYHFDHLKSLRYFNLANCGLDGNCLGNCDLPELRSLNLQGCKNCFVPDISGFQLLIYHSPLLQHINLSNIDYQCKTPGSPDELLVILSACRGLLALSLPSCWIYAASEQVKLQRPAFPVMIESCQHMREFELIHKGFTSMLASTHPVNLQSSKGISSVEVCGCVISGDMLTPISSWTYLTRLTLAGLALCGTGDFLVTITQHCTMLQFLSLAHLLPTLGHSSGVVCLHKALQYCHTLKDFRLEQPYFNITSQFLDSLHQARNLQRVCLITRKGMLARQRLIPWLDQCRKVVFLQVFCDITKKAAKEVKKILSARYSITRPGFFVNLYCYHGNADMSYTQGNRFDPELSLETPTVHLNELSLFSSRVATDWKLVNTAR